MSSPADFSRPSPEDGCYDVFLSFRGTDTRNGFTNYLYHSLRGEGVYTFMDVELLGEEIDSLFKIIETSRMAVVIFSENFAFSDWCLRELEMILQRKKEKKILVIPIFYKVEVGELKQLTGKTGKYLDEHIPKHGETIVKNWKAVVTSFGNVSGLSYKDSQDRSEYEFIKLVIAKINKKLLDCKETPESCNIKPNSNHEQTRDSIMVQMEKGSTSQQNIEISPISQLRQENRDSFTQSSTFSRTTAGQEGYYIVTTGYFQKSEQLTGKLLNIKPGVVNFVVERGKSSSTCLLLSNKTNSNVAFKVKTSQPLKYSVIYPNYNGVLLPRSTCQVLVTLLAQNVLPRNMKCSDMFMVESVKVKNDSYDPSTDDFSRMLTREWGNTMNTEKYWLNVLCAAPPPQPVSSVPAPDHVAQLHTKGLVHGSQTVYNIDLHPTKPWVLLNLNIGSVCIWNYKTRAEVKSLKVDDTHVNSPKFLHEKHWIVVGVLNGFVRVFDYNTSEMVKEFKAHEDYIMCVTVHPTLPYVFTTSNDKLIKFWNWKNDWACGETFYGHSDCVMDVAFNPKVSSSFASVSIDGTIKIWSFGSSVAKFTINTSAKQLKRVEYFVGNGDKLYLLSCSYENIVRVWDYGSKKLVQTLEGHSNNVMATLAHPKFPIIITGSSDKTIRIWNKNTHRLALVWNCDLGMIWSMRFIETSDEVVLGCDDGIVVIKICQC